MLTNRVSPASLCSSSSEHSNPDIMMSVGIDESQLSQSSLFGSDVSANSMELFSQSYSSQSQPCSTQSSIYSNRESSTVCLDDRRDSSQSNHCLPKVACGRKYYMRYLTSSSVGPTKPTETSMTPLCAERCGDTAFSRTAFEAWKMKQHEKLENKQIIDGVIQTTREITREDSCAVHKPKSIIFQVSQTLETLKEDIKAVITTSSQERQDSSDHQMRSVFVQLLQGQAEIKQQLTQIRKQSAVQQEQIASLQSQLSALVSNHLPSVQSDISECVHKCVTEALIEPLKASNAKMDKIMELMVHNNTHVKPTTDLHVHTQQSNTETATTKADVVPPPSDQAVPSLSVEEDPSGFIYEGMEPDNQRKRCHVSQDGDVSSDKSTTSNRTTTQATTNTTEQDSTDNDEPTVRPPVNTHTTSQGSCSTQYDIDLTQDSPSMCSQIISQRLEQCNSSQRQNHPLTAVNISQTPFSGTSRAQVEEDVPSTAPQRGSFPKRRKLQPSTPLRQRGGKRVVRRKGGMISTSLSKRRSQRIQKSAVSSGSPLVTPVVRRKKAVDSPMNALCDSFYSQTSTAQTSQCVSQSEHVPAAAISTQPISTGPLATGAKFQRSSEAARRRMNIMSGMASSSDSMLKEISASLRQQQLQRGHDVLSP